MQYTIEKCSYWLSNGCSCCEPYKDSYYKVMKPDGSHIGQVDFGNGETTEEHFMDTHEALEAILRDLNVEVEYDYKEEEYD
mgnify:CR=1 FL=1